MCLESHLLNVVNTGRIQSGTTVTVSSRPLAHACRVVPGLTQEAYRFGRRSNTCWNVCAGSRQPASGSGCPDSTSVRWPNVDVANLSRLGARCDMRVHARFDLPAGCDPHAPFSGSAATACPGQRRHIRVNVWASVCVVCEVYPIPICYRGDTPEKTPSAASRPSARRQDAMPASVHPCALGYWPLVFARGSPGTSDPRTAVRKESGRRWHGFVNRSRRSRSPSPTARQRDQKRHDRDGWPTLHGPTA